jgi:hyperosmotically inducible protein
MRQLGILLLSSIVAAACASNQPPEASSATVARATDVPNNGPDFSPASADGLATARAEKRSPAAPTQPAPNLNPPAETARSTPPNNDNANTTWGNGAEGNSATNSSPGNATASPAVHSSDADNTAVNERDRSSAALTPMDQGPSPADRSITTQIRQAVMRDGSLSFTAKNVKIITINGRVTLRGTVKTDAERAAIESAARKIAGSTQVESQLEVSK